MKIIGGAVIAGLVLASTPAFAAPPNKILVAGPEDDASAARVQKELDALGFETERVGPLDSCARLTVVGSAATAGAIGVVCSDGERMSILVSDGTFLRLRDVVVIKDDDDAPVRAAEITRATIAIEEENAAKPAPVTFRPDPSWETFDRPPAKPAPRKSVGRAPTFLASVGVSGVIGVDAKTPALSAELGVGIFRNLTVAARLDYPVGRAQFDPLGRLSDGTPPLRVQPGFLGLGIGLPLAEASSFFIPRLGAGIGAAWLDARATSGSSSNFVASFACFGSAALSIRVAGPIRLTLDGVFGSTTSRLVARNEGVEVAYWGTPFGVLGSRMELQLP